MWLERTISILLSVGHSIYIITKDKVGLVASLLSHGFNSEALVEKGENKEIFSDQDF